LKIFVDENIPLMTVRALRESGHDVLDIRGTAEEGSADDGVWSLVQRDGRLIITTDKGFAQRRSESHHGTLIVRLKHPNRHKIHERVLQAMARFSSGEWDGLLVVMRDQAQSFWRLVQDG
jgi:predicted nuclease of predicted toxin-antitoxin system